MIRKIRLNDQTEVISSRLSFNHEHHGSNRWQISGSDIYKKLASFNRNSEPLLTHELKSSSDFHGYLLLAVRFHHIFTYAKQSGRFRIDKIIES